MGKEDNLAEEISEVHTAELAAARASKFNDGHYDHYGKGRLDETVSKTQVQIMVGNYSEDAFVESHMPCGDSVLNLNEDVTNGPKIDKNELGQVETQSDRTMRSWTRINRMNVRPSEEFLSTNKLKLGKRKFGDVLEENCKAETMTLNQKRAKVKFGDGMSDSISAGVKDYPCSKP